MEAHGICLPSEFCNHVINNKPHTPIEENAKVDKEFWSSWCKARRVPAILDAAARLRKDCKAANRLKLQEECAELADEKELSDNTCIKYGCLNLALNDVVYCPEHYMTLGSHYQMPDTERQYFSMLLKEANRYALG